jgi:hypothetical protein
VFLSECDPDENYVKADRRRFRCYETAAIVAYARPFSASHGGVPPLSLEMAGVELNSEEMKLHHELVRLRNKVFAHSDADMMRVDAKAIPIELGDGRKFMWPAMDFDEGMTFIGLKLHQFDKLAHAVLAAVAQTLQREAQERPDDFNTRKDYLAPP